MAEFAEDLRHHCRNPRCRTKLAMPVANQHRAFCTPGCHSSFYLKRCIVCENDKPAGSTARRIVCRRPKCESKYRQDRGRYSFSDGDTTFAANVPRSAQSTGIKIEGLGDRPPYIVAGPKISACVYHCAAQPLDADTANRIYAANNWDRIRREIAWCLVRPPIPVDVTTKSRWKPCVPSVPVADDLSIPDFLKREPAAVSESPEGLLVAAE
jgi:hypothetical protein